MWFYNHCKAHACSILQTYLFVVFQSALWYTVSFANYVQWPSFIFNKLKWFIQNSDCVFSYMPELWHHLMHRNT
jgi:hypothetical protein